MNYTHEQLIEFADNRPQDLALAFARVVAGFPKAERNHNESRLSNSPRIVSENGGYTLPDYLADWTATINAIEKAELWWAKEVERFLKEPFYSINYEVRQAKHNRMSTCYQKPEWFPCCALMICAIEVRQNE